MKRASKMTIQLEFNFISVYAFESVYHLHVFSLASSTIANQSRNLARYKELHRQATDLKNYAFLHDYITVDEYERLTNLIFESAELVWS